jgi:hypothetical protein
MLYRICRKLKELDHKPRWRELNEYITKEDIEQRIKKLNSDFSQYEHWAEFEEGIEENE